MLHLPGENRRVLLWDLQEVLSWEVSRSTNVKVLSWRQVLLRRVSWSTMAPPCSSAESTAYSAPRDSRNGQGTIARSQWNVERPSTVGTSSFDKYFITTTYFYSRITTNAYDTIHRWSFAESATSITATSPPECVKSAHVPPIHANIASVDTNQRHKLGCSQR